jgi:hypothetical protein
MSALPNLTRILINTSRGNSKIYGNVSAPAPGTRGAVAFAPVEKVLQTRRGSVAQAGDTVIDLGDRFVLGYFNKTANDELFRMFRVPRAADVMRAVVGKDPVTGLERGAAPTKVGFAWFDVQQTGLTADIDMSKRSKYRVITGFELQTGDMLDGKKITSVTTELGVTIAEAE